MSGTNRNSTGAGAKFWTDEWAEIERKFREELATVYGDDEVGWRRLYIGEWAAPAEVDPAEKKRRKV